MLEQLSRQLAARIVSPNGETTVEAVLTDAKRAAAALTRWGVGPGVGVAVYLADRPEWLVIDVAVQLLGGELVVIEPGALSDRVRSILEARPARVVVTDAGERVATLASVLPALRASPLIVAVSERGDTVGAALVQRGEGELLSYRALLQLADSQVPSAEGAAAVSFSMGRDGPPRGYRVPAATFARQLEALPQLGPSDVQLVALSLAFPAARLAAWRALTAGATLALSDGLPPEQALPRFSPTHVLADPATFEHLYGAIHRSFNHAGGLPLRLFRWLLGLGEEVVWAREGRREADPGVQFFHGVARRLLRGRLHALLGGALRHGLCVLGPLSPEIARFFLMLGVEVSRSYGLTEVAPVLSRQPDGPNAPFSCESVGPALDGVTLRLSDGGLEVRAPGLQAEPLTGAPNEWVSTGDVAELRDQTLLSVAPRSAVLVPATDHAAVTATTLEAALTASPYVSTAVVVGHGRPFLSALIVLDSDGVIPFAREHGLEVARTSELADRPEVFALINGVVQRLNRELPGWEAIRKFAILDHPLAPERGELAVSRVPRREAVMARHAALIESMYSEQF